MKEWDPDIELIKEKLTSVSVWVKLHGLDVKYWGAMRLRKIGSFLGKPKMADENTQKKTRINFARILVDIEIKEAVKDKVVFKNEKGVLVE